MSSLEKLDAQLVGIGQMIKATRFSVPIYQRPYSWTDIEVDELYRDLGDALRTPKEDYFLGTVVTARSADSRLTIIDGQQRLVTVSIIVAAVRDYFVSVGQTCVRRQHPLIIKLKLCLARSAISRRSFRDETHPSRFDRDDCRTDAPVLGDLALRGCRRRSAPPRRRQSGSIQAGFLTGE